MLVLNGFIVFVTESVQLQAQHLWRLLDPVGLMSFRALLVVSLSELVDGTLVLVFPSLVNLLEANDSDENGGEGINHLLLDFLCTIYLMNRDYLSDRAFEIL